VNLFEASLRTRTLGDGNWCDRMDYPSGWIQFTVKVICVDCTNVPEVAVTVIL
jgi:hypothetical protein